jgi:poly(3-hydroxybutyrate) depolymerase
MPRLLAAVLALGAIATLAAAEPYAIRPIGSTKAPYGYLEHLPADIAAAPRRKRPLVIFLHGLGELGDSDKQLPKVAGAGPLRLIARNDPLAKIFAAQSAIILAPQGLRADGWWKTEKLTAFLDHALATYPVDPDRVYVTGLSMGGGGTWALVTAAADRIAAAVPICGAAGPGNCAVLHAMPIWAFHAFDDQTVKFADNTQGWFDGILADRGARPVGGVLDGYVRNDKPATGTLDKTAWTWAAGDTPAAPVARRALILTVYPTGGHDSWTRAYSDPALWPWLFAQKRGGGIAAKKP